MMKRNMIIIILLILFWVATVRADTPHMVGLVSGEAVEVACNGGETVMRVYDGVGESVILYCPAAK